MCFELQLRVPGFSIIVLIDLGAAYVGKKKFSVFAREQWRMATSHLMDCKLPGSKGKNSTYADHMSLFQRRRVPISSFEKQGFLLVQNSPKAMELQTHLPPPPSSPHKTCADLEGCDSSERSNDASLGLCKRSGLILAAALQGGLCKDYCSFFTNQEPEDQVGPQGLVPVVIASKWRGQGWLVAPSGHSLGSWQSCTP